MIGWLKTQWHGQGFIETRHKAHRQVLEKAIAVLDAAGMLERDPHPKYEGCNVRIINKPVPRVDYTTGL